MFPICGSHDCQARDVSFCVQQREFIIKKNALRSFFSVGDRWDVVLQMIESDDIATTPAHENDAGWFVPQKVTEFIGNSLMRH